MGGELYDYVSITSSMNNQGDDRAAAFFGKHILTGLYDTHARGVSHRDVKLDNVMLQFDGTAVVAKLIDLGCLAQFGPEALNETLVGTPAYIAPEVIK